MDTPSSQPPVLHHSIPSLSPSQPATIPSLVPTPPQQPPTQQPYPPAITIKSLITPPIITRLHRPLFRWSSFGWWRINEHEHEHEHEGNEDEGRVAVGGEEGWETDWLCVGEGKGILFFIFFNYFCYFILFFLFFGYITYKKRSYYKQQHSWISDLII